MKLFLIGFAVGLFFSWSCITTFVSGMTFGVVLTLSHPSIANDVCSMIVNVTSYSTTSKSEKSETGPILQQDSSPNTCVDTSGESTLPKDKLQ